MALVVLTHLLSLRAEFRGLSPLLLSAMVSFNMPLFAALSGYVLFGREGSRPGRFLGRKALGLLVPYTLWIAIELPLRRVGPSEWLPRLARALANPHAGLQMWFLWALFWLFVVFVCARLVSRSDWWTAAVAIVLGALVFVAPKSFGLDKVCLLYPFFAGGYLAAKHRDALRRYEGPAAVLGAAVFAALAVAGSAALRTPLAGGAAGTLASWGLFRAFPRRVLSAMACVGRRTMGLYGWQMVVLPFLVVGSGWAGAAASWVLVFTVSVLLTLAIERWAVTRALLLGQWPRRAADA